MKASRPAAGLLFGFLLALPGGRLAANEPCAPESWYGNRNRPSAEWARLAKWIAVARITAREEIVRPYANCYMQDRSKCAMDDESVVTVRILKSEKGGAAGIRRLRKGYCAPDPPKRAGQTLRFYGAEPDVYIFFEKFSP